MTSLAVGAAFGKIIPSKNPNEFTLIAPLRTRAGEASAAKIGLVNLQTELDPLVARQFGQIIAENPTATRAYSQMQKFGTEVKLDFGTPPEKGLLGQHFRFKNKMEIYNMQLTYIKIPLYRLNYASDLSEINLDQEFLDELRDEYETEERKSIFEQLDWAVKNPGYNFKSLVTSDKVHQQRNL